MLGARIGHTTYAQYYDDPTKETWQGVLADIYQQIDVDAGVTPQALRTLFYEAGNNRDAVCILVHVRDPNANADDPGTIRLVHRLTRFVHVRALVRQRPFPNLGHGFLGDVRRNGQAPASVEIPDNLFNRINVNTQVPDHGLLDQELNADPNLQLAGPYPAGTADTSPVDSRQAIMVPNFIARMFLHQGMKPRDAYQAIYGAVQAAGMMGDCDPLLNWIRLALTRPAAGQPPRTAIAPLTPPVIATQEGQDLFLDYRLEHLHYDLPGLAPGAMLALGQIAHQGFASLTQEQHLTRLEAATVDQRDMIRKVTDCNTLQTEVDVSQSEDVLYDDGENSGSDGNIHNWEIDQEGVQCKEELVSEGTRRADGLFRPNMVLTARRGRRLCKAMLAFFLLLVLIAAILGVAIRLRRKELDLTDTESGRKICEGNDMTGQAIAEAKRVGATRVRLSCKRENLRSP